MARFRVKGPAGAVALVTVPSPGVDQRTFDRRVADGEWTVIEQVDGTPAPTPEPEPEADPEPEPETVERPPEAGPGSSRKAWAEFAQAKGVEVSEDDTRDDIIAKVDR